jgi:hypothetical protein
MDIRPHLKALGLLFSLMLVVTVVTAFVALRLRTSTGGAGPTGQSIQSGQPAAAAAATGASIAAPERLSGAGKPPSAGPVGGQCTSGATSLVESQALEGGIDSGLGAIRMPTATSAAP